MDASMVSAYRALNEAQAAIGRAQTLDEALQEGLKVILENCKALWGVIWYAEEGELDLRPFFWVGPFDLTSCEHHAGTGAPGRVFETQAAERYLDFRPTDDPVSVEDFAGEDITSMICVPLMAGSVPLGAVQFINKEGGGHFTDEEADVCEMMVMLAGMALGENENLVPVRKVGETIMRVRDVKREFVNGDSVTQVLKGVNLDVYAGEFLILLGESGCGKSTLLNIIGGMDQPTSGTVECFGHNIEGASTDELCAYRRDKIGFIFQSYNLMPNLNARQNLELIASLTDDPMPIEEALEHVNLVERQYNYPSQMSGGQQQRVSIARALVKRPPVILADEPTAALDYATSIEVLSVMESIVDDGTTLIMVTHNEEICRMADRVVRMRGGRMHEVTVNRRKAHATDLVW